MRSFILHLRYTVRLLLKSPGFTITAALILGLGTGLNTAIFSLINTVILKPLVLAYLVSQRKRELGVRIALGAQGLNILRLVIGHGFKMVWIGLIIGIAAALVLARFIQGILYGVSSNDPITLGIAVLVLVVAGLLACLLPALRATRTDPIKALRE